MNARTTLILGLLSTVLASFAFYTFALKPKREEAAELATQITQQEQALGAARALLAGNQEAKEGYAKAYATVVRLGKAIPADDDVRSLLVQLRAAAAKTGVDFASIDVGGSTTGATGTPDATAGTAGFPTVSFSFTFGGPFFKLSDFFERVHEFVRASNVEMKVSGRLLTLNSIKLEPDTTGFPRIAATVDATAYQVAPIEGATAGATAAGPATAGAVPAATPAAGGAPSTPSTPSTTTATSTGAIG